MLKKIDIRFKLLITILLAVFTASTQKGNYSILFIYFIAAIAAVVLFRPSLKIYLKRVFAVFLFPLSISVFIPFANRGNVLQSFDLYFFTISLTDNGLAIFISTLLKSFISLMAVAALVTSSADIEILYGLKKIYFPRIIVSMIFLMYRYLFLMRDELRTGQLAISSRVFSKSYNNVNKRLTFLAGSLFIKSFDRAENIYKSMESRGYTGDFYLTGCKEKAGYRDIVILSIFVLALVAAKCLELSKILSW